MMYGFFVGIVSQYLILTYFIQAQDVPTGNGAGCVYILTSPSGTIETPNYPQKYPSNAACKWTIKAPTGSLINLSFDYFLIENSRSCRSDYLLLFDGKDSSSRKVGRYCGKNHPEDMTSSTNYIHLEFNSDKFLNYKGFHASYNIRSPPTTKPTIWRSHPKFVHSPSNKTVTEGYLLELTCSVEGSPEPTITWRKDSQNLTNYEQVVIQDSSFKSVLTINKVSVSDAGIYSCVAYNGVGATIKSDCWVDVKERVLPVITNATTNQTVRIGSNVTLFCKGTGPPPLTTRWIENTETLAENTCERSKNCSISLTRNFTKVTVVRCEIVNKAGNVTKDVRIKIKGPPLITNAPQDAKTEVGVLVNFSCEAIGVFPVQMSWMKDNDTVSSGVSTANGWSVITFHALKNTTVTCNAKDQDGVTSKHAKLTVTEVPQPSTPTTPPVKRVALTFVVKPLDLNLKHNATTTLRCKARGFPEPRISWMQDGENVTENAFVMNGTSTLTLKLEEDESSTVTCIALNPNENIQSVALITRFSEPSVQSRKSGDFSDKMKVVLGSVGGLLLLIIVIVIFVLRRWRVKKYSAEQERAEERARETESLVLNPTYNNKGKGSGSSQGIEMLHVPQENIVYCEDVDDEINVRLYLGRARDLPLTKRGEYKVIVRALKDTDPSEERREEFAMEASSLVNLVHPNVARLMAVSMKSPPLSLVFECSEYGYLDAYLQACDVVNFVKPEKKKTVEVPPPKLSNVDRISMAKQIAAGMRYLTEKGYVHQELRACNCMVFKDLQVKVTNLGMRWVNPPEQSFFDMDPIEKESFPVRWLSPEVVMYGSYSVSADVWSYGIVVWEIFSNGQLPYSGISDHDVVTYIRGRNVLPRPKACPHEIYEVLKSCWEITPLERPSFAALYESMSSFYDVVPEVGTK